MGVFLLVLINAMNDKLEAEAVILLTKLENSETIQPDVESAITKVSSQISSETVRCRSKPCRYKLMSLFFHNGPND